MNIVFALTAFTIPLSISMMQIMQVVVLSIFFYGIYTKRYTGILNNSYLPFFAALILMLIITSALGINPSRSFDKLKQMSLPLLFIVGYYMYDGKWLKYFVMGAAVGCVASILYGYVHWYFHYDPKYYRSLGGALRAQVIFGYVVALISTMVNGAILFGIYKDVRWRNTLIALNIIMIVGLFSTTTRGAIIAYGYAFVFLMTIALGKRGAIMCLALAAIGIAVALAMPTLRDSFTEIYLKWGSQRTSLGWRFVLWQEGLAIFRDYPLFGIGPNNSKLVYEIIPRHLSTAHSHNNYIQTLVDFGIVGAVIYWSIYVKLFIDQFKGVMKRIPYAYIGFALTIVFLIAGVTETTYYGREIHTFFALSTGALLRAQHNIEGFNYSRHKL